MNGQNRKRREKAANKAWHRLRSFLWGTESKQGSNWSFSPLEERLLLSADASVITEMGSHEAETAWVARNPLEQATQSQSLVFIDARADAAEWLAEDVRSRAEVIIVQSDESGIQAITRALERRSQVSSIHVVGHGSEGRLQLGQDGLSLESLHDHEREIRTWSQALTQHADILLYGCFTGSGEAGFKLIEQLAALTGADVAASDDATGSAELHGDWLLERATGAIETPLVFSRRLQEQYRKTFPITIRAAGATGQESMSLLIDGNVVQTWNNIGGNFNSGIFQSFTYNASGIAADRIQVAFTNDSISGGVDRNLRVDSINIDGRVIQTESRQVYSTGTWTAADGTKPGFLQSEILHSNGYFQYADLPTNPFNQLIVIRAAGTTGTESMELQVNGQVAGRWTNVGGDISRGFYRTFVVGLNSPPSGLVTADQIRVAFTNDSYDAATGLDRNLAVDAIAVDNAIYQTESSNVLSTGTWQPGPNLALPGFFSTEYLTNNGYFEYSQQASNNTGSQVIIYAAGTFGGEKMQLLVDGRVVRSWQVEGGAYENNLKAFGFRSASTITADQVRIALVDAQYQAGVRDDNLRVDRIVIDGKTFETEAANVFSTATWKPTDGFVHGYRESEYLHHNGYFQYASAPVRPGSLSLASSVYTVSENDSSITIIVNRRNGTDGTVTVQYATVPITATAGQDFSARTGTLTFLPGQSSASVVIPILNDTAYEGNETFNFTIDNVGGAATLLAPRTATITISDDDAVLPNFANFSTVASLQLNGMATSDGGTLRLTRATTNQIGSAFFRTPVPVNGSTSFQTSFGFRLDGGEGTNGGDGFAFVIQNSSAAISAISTQPGNSLGHVGILKSLAIEFDTFNNPGEPSNNHVAVVVNGQTSALITRNSTIDFNSGSNLRAWIDYNGDANSLAVYVSNSSTKPTTPLLVTSIDLAELVGNQAYVGFTAATGDYDNNHRILDWSMSLSAPTIPTPPSGNNLLREVIASGYIQPTAMEFSPDGKNTYVAQKAGQVYVIRNGLRLADPFIDISAQVNSTRDRGLLDIAVHPDFVNNPYVYLLFTYDPPEVYENASHPLAGPDKNGNRAGRLIRVTADAATNYTTAVAGSEVVLLGKNSIWANFNAFVNSTNDFSEPPAGIRPDGTNIEDFIATDSESHTVGSVEFGPDGYLYVSIGDGTSYNRVDPRTVRVQDINNLSGKILRIDPITGKGLASNPFYNGNPDANRSKVYQYGLRNPFRISLDPQTGRLFVGDVGWGQWEEINSAGPGANFGWPYYEGGDGISLRTNGYQDLAQAQAFYASGQPVQASLLGLNHAATGINAIVMGDVYRGTAYPSQFQGDVFFNDLGQGIVRNVSFNSDGTIAKIETFTTGAQYVVQIIQGPDGNLYFVDLDDGWIGRWVFA